MAIFSKLAKALSSWEQRYNGAINFIYIAAFAIGVCTGAAAALLKWLITLIENLCHSGFGLSHGNALLLFLPIAGILLATALTRYYVHKPMAHASEQIQEDMSKGQNEISPRLIPGTLIGCAVTLGMGGSAGGEDPIAYTGAAIGSNVGKVLKMDEDNLAIMVGCGAASGIAGIFMAPIGGVMFALEVLNMKTSLKSILAVILSSLISALTCYILLGCHSDVTFMPQMSFELKLVPYVMLCGVFCGLYSLYYRSIMSSTRKVFKKVSNIWLKALTGGVCVSVALFFFPSLYGEGYHIIAKLMAQDPLSVVSYGPLYHFGQHHYVLMGLILLAAFVKPIATSATNNTGGVGGDFTPTFFAGALVGFFFAFALNTLFHLELSYPLFAFFGMAAVMAGAIEAPLMAIFITAEMTDLDGFILPLAIAAACSYTTVAILATIKSSPFKRTPSDTK